VPEELTAGGAEKSAGLLFEVAKLRIWPDSLAGPAEMAVAQFGTDCAPEFCTTI
jgi:hypothetical protein